MTMAGDMELTRHMQLQLQRKESVVSEEQFLDCNKCLRLVSPSIRANPLLTYCATQSLAGDMELTPLSAKAINKWVKQFPKSSFSTAINASDLSPSIRANPLLDRTSR